MDFDSKDKAFRLAGSLRQFKLQLSQRILNFDALDTLRAMAICQNDTWQMLENWISYKALPIYKKNNELVLINFDFTVNMIKLKSPFWRKI